MTDSYYNRYLINEFEIDPLVLEITEKAEKKLVVSTLLR